MQSKIIQEQSCRKRFDNPVIYLKILMGFEKTQISQVRLFKSYTDFYYKIKGNFFTKKKKF